MPCKMPGQSYFSCSTVRQCVCRGHPGCLGGPLPEAQPIARDSKTVPALDNHVMTIQLTAKGDPCEWRSRGSFKKL